MSWTDTEKAIQACVVKGSGLAGNHVIWANPTTTDGQMSNRPPGQHIELFLLGIVRAGGRDGTVAVANPDASPGNTDFDSTLLRTVGTRLITITVTCYGGATVGENQPMGVLMGVQARMAQDSQGELFSLAGIALKQVDGVLSLKGRVIDGARIEPAAVFTAQFWASPAAVPGSVEDTCSTIAHVVVHGDVFGPAGTIDFTTPDDLP